MKRLSLLSCLILLAGGLCPAAAATMEEGITAPALKKAWDELRADRPQEALAVLARSKVNGQDACYRSFLLGRTYEALGQSPEALVWYRSAYFQAPNEEIKALALLERAEAYFRLRHYDEARIIYRIFFQSFSIPRLQARAHLGVARCLSRQGVWEDALQHYQQAGEGAMALLGRAVVLHNLGRFSEAGECFQKGIALDKELFSRHQEFLFHYGENLLELGQGRQALPYLTYKLTDPVYQKKGELALGRAALKNRNYSEAQRLLEGARLSPDLRTREEAQFLLAETFQAMGKKEWARQAFWEYWSSYPMGRAYEDVLVRLAGLDLEGGPRERAFRFLQELGFFPRLRQETLDRLEGLILQLKEKDPQKIPLLWKVTGRHFLDPKRESFLLVMAETLKDSGGVYFELLRWLARNGSQTVRWRCRSTLVRRSIEEGRFQEAEMELRSLQADKIPADEIKRLQALLHQARGEYRQAGRALLAVKNLEAKDLALLQDSLLLGGEGDQALKALEKQVLRLGGNARTYNRLADFYLAKGKKKEALHYYQKVLERDPLNEWALLRAGSLTEGEEGRKMLSKLKEEKSLVGRMAQVYLKEKEIQTRLEEGR